MAMDVRTWASYYPPFGQQPRPVVLLGDYDHGGPTVRVLFEDTGERASVRRSDLEVTR